LRFPLFVLAGQVAVAGIHAEAAEAEGFRVEAFAVGAAVLGRVDMEDAGLAFHCRSSY